jgi:hypothetical protein
MHWAALRKRYRTTPWHYAGALGGILSHAMRNIGLLIATCTTPWNAILIVKRAERDDRTPT